MTDSRMIQGLLDLANAQSAYGAQNDPVIVSALREAAARIQALAALPGKWPLPPGKLEEIRHVDKGLADHALDQLPLAFADRRQLLAALNHSLAAWREAETWCARMATDHEGYRAGEEAGRAAEDARFAAILAEAKALAVKDRADNESAPAEIVLDWLDAAWIASREPAERPPRERTLALLERRTKALYDLRHCLGDLPMLTEQSSHLTECLVAAIEALKEDAP